MDVEELRRAGTSPGAIRQHYDLSDDFFRLWLGPEMVYSCGLWDDGSVDALDAAQVRKLDFFAGRLRVANAHVLDIGSGWGALLARWKHDHKLAAGVGLTLSAGQQAFAAKRDVADVDYRLESWVDHDPVERYDAITCIEMSEHLASDDLSVDEKVEVYRAFFDRCAHWLKPGGRMGLQVICLDNVSHEGSRAGRGPLSELLRTEIFPESMPGSLAELVLGWEAQFHLDELLEHADHYRRTFRAWSLAARAAAERARMMVGEETLRTFMRYFAAGELCFRRKEHTLYRVILTKRAEPKAWVAPLVPSLLSIPEPGSTGGEPGQGTQEEAGEAPAGASAEAVRAHYDVSNDFYRLWLGPTMMYSSAMWSGAPVTAAADEVLEHGHEEKLRFFARHVLAVDADRVLDVGCGWGWALRWLTETHRVASGVGLTLSEAQRDYIAGDPIAGVDVRVEGWSEHHPSGLYDAILSFGAFEHFAKDGTSGAERVATYRAFFARCFSWLEPNGRMGVETIIHDSAPDTARAKGRGPLGDHVLALFPESICPHLHEVVLGFEPYFEVEVVRSDAADFARTFRAWQLRLRSGQQEAVDLVGADTMARWRRYLASSEVQFRMRTLSNLRLVLHRRPVVRR